MKVDNRNTSSWIEYIELCRTLRKSMKEDIRKFNCELVMKAIENNKSLMDVKESLSVGKEHIIALKEEDGTLTRNMEEILRRVEEFYRKQYENKSELNEDTEIVEGTVPKILKQEVSFAMQNMKKGKAFVDEGITLDMLKEAGEYVEDILGKFINKCLNSGNIPNQWDSATVILLNNKGDSLGDSPLDSFV